MSKVLKIFLVMACLPIMLFLMLAIYVLVDVQVFNAKSTGPVIGELGGVPVAIPRPFARFVEYDADPHFMERKGWSSPERTFQSNLRSFGFEVRYPDMAPIEAQSPAEEDIYTTMLMRVGVSTGEDYGDDKNLNRMKARYLNQDRPCISRDHCYIYEPLPEKTHGLTGYTPTGSGVDLDRRNIESGRGADIRDSNIYFSLDNSGRVTTFVNCSNVTHAAGRCKQYFNLTPYMKVHVWVNYRKALLPHWQQIQQSVTELLYNFEANPVASGRAN
jgi:hypothetical protein